MGGLKGSYSVGGGKKKFVGSGSMERPKPTTTTSAKPKPTTTSSIAQYKNAPAPEGMPKVPTSTTSKPITTTTVKRKPVTGPDNVAAFKKKQLTNEQQLKMLLKQ